jgi:hypothetical protein
MATEGDERRGLFGQVFSRLPATQTDSSSLGREGDVSQMTEEQVNDPENRIKRLNKPFWIGYKGALAARDRVEEVLSTPYSDRITSCAVIAPSYNGKTSVFRNVQRRHNFLPADYQPGSLAKLPHIQIPVFFVQSPPMPDEDRLLSAILRALNMLGSPREPAEYKIARIQAIFAGLGVKLLLLDEFGFFQAGSADKQRKALNGLKYLSNELKIPIVLASVEEGLNILTTSSEISNRFPAVHLIKWQADADETLSLLASFEVKLGLKESSELGTEKMARLVVANTDGILGHIHDLLRLLARKAIREGTERIALADLQPSALKAQGWILPSLRHQRPT